MRLILNIILMILCILLMKVLTNQAPTTGESLILGCLVSIITNQEKILEGVRNESIRSKDPLYRGRNCTKD